MVATRRMVHASTSAQRARRVVARATPQRPKRSRSASTTSATRDAAGLPPRTRARRALLTTAVDPTPLRRYLSPARSSSDCGPFLSRYHAAAPPAPSSTHPHLHDRAAGSYTHTLRPHGCYADSAGGSRRPASRHHASGAARASNAAGASASADSTRTKRAPSGAASGFLGGSHPPPEPAGGARFPAAKRPQQSGSCASPTRARVGPLLLLQCSRSWTPCLPLVPAGVPAGSNTLLQVPGPCRAPGYCPVSWPRRQYFIRSTRFPYLEVDRLGHSYYIRADLPSPAWFHPGLLRAVLAHERPAPQAPQQPSVAVVQLHPGATDVLPAPPDTADPRPTTPPPADPPAAQRAVFCAAPSASGAVAPPPAICNHTRLGTPPRTPKGPTHTRAWATIDGIRCEVIIDADRVALDVRLGPLKTTAPFFVVPGVAFAALLGVDFLYEHEIAVSLGRHALTFEGHGGQIVPLLGHHLRLAPLCALAHDVALCPGSTAWVCTTLAAPGAAPAPPLIYLVAASTLPGVGLTIPKQLTSGLIAIRNTADRPLHLSAGWPLAKAVRLPPTAIHIVRLVATDPAPPPAEGAADAPSYERVPGGFIPTLPSPNRCLSPAELQQLRDLLHEFRDRFNDGSEPLPATSLLKARLDTGDAQPISTPPRRLSPAMRQAVREAIAELDAQRIKELSTGCWSTPIVMVRKASGAWRLCCDYRAINKQVRIPQQPLPRTDDILASLARMVDLLLGGMKWVSAVGYIDDIIVYRDTWDAHRAHLRQLFQALRDANLQLHPGKCSFGAAAAAARQKEVTWTPAADTAWRALCKALSSEPVLAHPDYTRPFYLDCDGSGDGLDAVLLQPYDEGERVVAYASRSLLDHERKWTATELEAAALIWALETLHH
ncbi:hypothetical protein Emag_007296 [Eimeria magna]